MSEEFIIHASAVAIRDQAVMIMGKSGVGKSDLALRLIDRGAQLIADDQICLNGAYDKPIISHTKHHIEAIEVNGLGIIYMPSLNHMPLKLMVKLSDNYERNPMPLAINEYGSYHIPCIKISSNEASAPIKIEMALKHLDHLTNIK